MPKKSSGSLQSSSSPILNWFYRNYHCYFYPLKQRILSKIDFYYDKFILWFCFPSLKVKKAEFKLSRTMISREITELVGARINALENPNILKSPESDDDYFAEDFYLDLYREIDDILEKRLGHK